MKKLSLLLFGVAIITSLWISSINAKAIDITQEYAGTIGEYMQVYQRDDIHLEAYSAFEAFRSGQFSSINHSVINFGINSKPVWFALRVNNPHHNAIHRNILFEVPWLDNIDVYFFRQNQIINNHHIGDTLPFSTRPINHRFFVIDHSYESGETIVLIRIQSIDVMMLPIYFMSDEKLADRTTVQNYSYGFVYGFILALVAYNFMLYIGLRSNPYLFYSIYLLSFLILNIAYTGHGYQWLWPNSPTWQQWSNPILIIVCSVSGLFFALHFLNIKTTLIRVYRIVIGCCLSFSALIAVMMLSGNYAVTLLTSLFFIFISSILMIILGIISLRLGNRFAKYFLWASICTICGAAVTANAIWGLIPFNLLTYRAVEIGMMGDAILLALALTKRFNISQDEKLIAEKMAGIDSLTNLNNRRSFYKFVKPIWALSLRNKSHTSIVMIDIDNFKIFNDNYGHAFGDQVLIHFADTLQKEARSGDILARWGGEEFLIFLPDTKLADAITLAERLREKISTIQLATAIGKKISLTASFGVAHTNDNEISLDELICVADQQLYYAKKQGRNCVYAKEAG